MIVPPPPRASADRRPAHRRPRAGAAGARGRDGLPGDRLRGAHGGRWRPRRQHEPDRLPGGLHRPLVRRPGRRHDLSAHRQLRPPRRRRPVGEAMAAGAGRGQRHGRRPRGRPPARSPPARRTASRPSPGSIRGRWPGTCARTAACAGIVTAPGEMDVEAARAAARGVPRWEDQDFVGQVSPPSITEYGSRRRRGAAGRDRRPRPQVEHRARDAPSRRAGPRVPAHRRRVRGPVVATSTG